jgi:deoxyribodipyrimidine photolyase
MTPPRWLFWHRRDLRLADNLGLAAAAATTPAVTGVVVLDPAELAAVQQAPARLWFLAESLRELAGRWRAAGSRLVILQGDPVELLPRLTAATGAAVVAWNRGVEPSERERDRRVAAALQGDGVKVLVDWDQLLVPPETILTGAGDPYRVYGPFLRNWRGQVERRAAAGELDPRPAPRELLDLDPAALPRPELWAALPLLESVPGAGQLAAIAAGGAGGGEAGSGEAGDKGTVRVRHGESDGGYHPSTHPREASEADRSESRRAPEAELAEVRSGRLSDAGAELAQAPFPGADLCPCRPGEAAALAQLEAFADGQALPSYEQGRNLPGEAGTSALSAALRFGTLSPRQAWAAAAVARFAARSDEALASITVWEQELCWREFYQQALFHFPELADGPYRPQWRHFPWENDPQRLAAWQQGLTGMPIVDAAMRQLVESGWMHNRPRMIVASYLVKDLICDWRLGERFFMEHLVDGDLAANNGGWQWSASSGMDPKPLRIFNPATQAAKFDPEATYIRTWLPELAHVATADLISGHIGALERRGYPEPIVDHKLQQARFKALYAGLPRG